MSIKPNNIILGSAQFGLDYGINNKSGQVDLKEIQKILFSAQEFGINIIDTAEAYGNALSVFNKLNRHVKRFKFINKFIYSEKMNLGELIRKGLTLLNQEKFYCYMYHRYSDYIAHTFLIDDLLLAKEHGLIDNIGVSVYSNEQLENCILNRSIDLVQVPFNLLDNRIRKNKLFELAQKNETIIHVRSVFLQGAFFKNHFEGKIKGLESQILSLQQLAIDIGVSMEELAINYVAGNNNINGIILGVDSNKQLESNINCTQKPLSEEIRLRIESIELEDLTLLNPMYWS